MQETHYNNSSSTLNQSEHGHAPLGKTANVPASPYTASDLYGSSGNASAAGFQYYYNAYSWPQNLASNNGMCHGEQGSTANMLLQYTAGHGGHFYPSMYPSVISAAFGSDVMTTTDAAGNTIAFDPSILELRKEKSRDAARSRRGKENYEFYELAKMLPLPGAITSQLDKASIIRLTISFLKLRDFSGHGDPPWQRDPPSGCKGGKGNSRRRNISAMPLDMFEAHQGTHILQSLDGFAFALSNDGRFLYISETVSIYLGLSQVEMTGSSIFDYIHIQDHQELAEQLGLNSQGHYTSSSGGSEEGSHSNASRAVTPTLPERTSIMNPSPSKGYDRCFCIRMKSTLTKRGVHVKSSGYRVVQFMGHMRPQFSYSLARKHPPPLLGLVGLAIALPPPTMTELVIDNDMFVTRLSPELKITYCEPRIGDMMDITSEDLTNKNLYDYCHAEDLQKLRKAHVDLLGKGQVLTDYYRLMNKHGGYIWVQTCATIICNAKNAEEQNIIAINYVLSGVEYSGCVMNTNQLKVVTKTEPDQSDHSENEHGMEKEEKNSKEDKISTRRLERQQNGDERGHHGNKRRQARKDSHPTENQPVDRTRSPVHSFDLLYQQHKSLAKEAMQVANGVVLRTDSLSALDKHAKQSLDLKNSRRKMDKPRKRKRDSDDPDPDDKIDLSLPAVDGNSDFDLSSSIGPEAAVNSAIDAPEASLVAPVVSMVGTSPTNTHSLRQSTSPQAPGHHPPSHASPAPEDLSVRTSQSPIAGTMSPAGHRSVTPLVNHMVATDGTANTSTSAAVVTSEALQQTYLVNTQVNPTTDSIVDIPTSCTSSVRDLEEAMNKHLPSVPGEAEHIRASLAAATATDYNQSMLGLHQKQKSTIQWIGSQGQTVTTDGVLPATNLLRSLYANRESVIRSNIYNPRPQYYGTDMQNSLLTPPGGSSEAYKENSPTSSTNYPGLIPTYSTSPISVTMATTQMTDAYAMTPPSSVSPQEKYASPFAEQFHGDMSVSAGLRGYASTTSIHDGSVTMPIKPQAYPLPAHANSHVSNYDRSAQYSNSPGYYGSTFNPYNHATSPSPAHYRDARTPNGVW